MSATDVACHTSYLNNYQPIIKYYDHTEHWCKYPSSTTTVAILFNWPSFPDLLTLG